MVGKAALRVVMSQTWTPPAVGLEDRGHVDVVDVQAEHFALGDAHERPALVEIDGTTGFMPRGVEHPWFVG
jgi:hypothetical protein